MRTQIRSMSIIGLPGVAGLVRNGSLAGVATGGLLATADALLDQGRPFGFLTGMIGITTGGMLLVQGLKLTLASYLLAARNKAPALRRRLLTIAIWNGATGMACGLTTATIWLAAGLPIPG